jgi:hypothetical protein
VPGAAKTSRERFEQAAFALVGALHGKWARVTPNAEGKDYRYFSKDDRIMFLYLLNIVAGRDPIVREL